MLLIKQKLFPAFFSSDDMNEWLKENGITLGKKCRFYRPASILIDISKPASLRIGSYAKITSHVKILAHDYSYSVIRRVYGDLVEKSVFTDIGDNVFIGVGAIILPGTKIGDNVIIGAGSVVSGNIPSNVVVAGNPCKVIRSLDEHYNLLLSKWKENACREYHRLKNYYRRTPTIKEMGNFYPLFTQRDIGNIRRLGLRTNLGGDEESEFIEYLMNSKPVFNSYEQFCTWADSCEVEIASVTCDTLSKLRKNL